MSKRSNRIARELAAELTGGPTDPLAAQPNAERTAEPTDALTEESLDRLLAKLDLLQDPAPTPESTQALIERLRPLVPAPKPARFRQTGLSREPLLTFLASLLLQARLLGRGWWIGTGLALPVGYLLASSVAESGLSPAAIAPPLVVLGLLWALRPMRGAALQIELTAPVTPAQVILGRLLLTGAAHLAVGALLWLLLGAPGALLLPWTAALCLFSGLTLLLTLFGGTLAALTGATTLWVLQLLTVTRGLSLFALPRAASLGAQLGALLAGLLLTVIAIRLAPLQRLVGRAD